MPVKYGLKGIFSVSEGPYKRSPINPIMNPRNTETLLEINVVIFPI